MPEDKGGSADLISKDKFHEMIKMLDQDGDGTVSKVRASNEWHCLPLQRLQRVCNCVRLISACCLLPAQR